MLTDPQTQTALAEATAPSTTELISIVIPAYNEEAAIAEVIENIIATMDSSGYRYELLVVDDGSTDGTAEVVRGFSRVRLVQHPRNRGTGAATNTAVKQARGEIVVMTDGDGTYPVQDIPRLLEHINEYDMVIGARVREAGTLKFLRVPAKWFIQTLASYLVEYNIPDLNSGLRAYRKSLALKFMHLLPRGHSWVSTLTLAHLADDYTVKFIPIEYYPRKGRSTWNWLGDTYNYFLLVIRTVMYFNPMKVFFPIGFLMLAIGAGRQLWWFATANLHVLSSNVLLVLAGLNLLMIGLLADLIVRRVRS